jgi:hypothetical protein
MLYHLPNKPGDLAGPSVLLCCMFLVINVVDPLSEQLFTAWQGFLKVVLNE